MAAKNELVLTARDDLADCMSISPEVNLAGYGAGPDLFKAVAGSLPTGVTVITGRNPDGGPAGMTSGAVCSLSCSPPLLLACISRESRTLAAIKHTEMFGVHVLDENSLRLADRFASRLPDKFDGVRWEFDGNGVPTLTEGVLAVAVCQLYRVADGGDHVIVIGLILDGRVIGDGAPLVYHRRRYAGFPAHQP